MSKTGELSTKEVDAMLQDEDGEEMPLPPPPSKRHCQHWNEHGPGTGKDDIYCVISLHAIRCFA
jgi:hypothetical protein